MIDGALVELFPYRRVQHFLMAAAAVWLGRACFTEVGCEYLGVPFSFRSPWYESWTPES